jgi:hypothetical protein
VSPQKERHALQRRASAAQRAAKFHNYFLAAAIHFATMSFRGRQGGADLGSARFFYAVQFNSVHLKIRWIATIVGAFPIGHRTLTSHDAD